MELSLLCNQHIAIYIYDKNWNKMVQYNSSRNFSLNKIRELLSDNQVKKSDNYERYSNKEYDQLKSSKITTIIKGVERKKMKKRSNKNSQQNGQNTVPRPHERHLQVITESDDEDQFESDDESYESEQNDIVDFKEFSSSQEQKSADLLN